MPPALLSMAFSPYTTVREVAYMPLYWLRYMMDSAIALFVGIYKPWNLLNKSEYEGNILLYFKLTANKKYKYIIKTYRLVWKIY